MEQTKELSLGEYRVGVTFNPGGNPVVDTIKAKTAELIDLVELLKNGDSEKGRLASLAQTHFEDAAMWAVKAATKQPKQPK